MASLVGNGDVVQNQLLVLKEYIVNAAAAKSKMVIIMQMEPVAYEEGAELTKIGEPTKWDSEEANAAYAAATAAAAEAVTTKAGSPIGSAPKQGSPKTGEGVSRTNASSAFPANSRPVPPPAPPGQPLVAGRSIPIDGLNPYSNKWQIKARVVSKGDLRTYSGAKGEGSVFSVDLSDDSAEIRATAWREVADRMYNQIEVGQTYLIARGRLQIANKKFNQLNNPYEITFTYDTQIQLCADEPVSKPKTHFRFCNISDIANRPANSVVDIIGVVSNVSTCTSLTSQKTGKELTKRTLNIADDSGNGTSIEMTLWGQQASNFPDMDASEVNVVAFKGLRVTEWNQRSLGSSHSTIVEVNPTELEQTARLKEWWEGGGNAGVESLSVDQRGNGTGTQINKDERTTCQEFYEKGEGMTTSSEPAYASIRCYFSKLTNGGGQGGEERSIWYSSCPKCNKKVVGDDASGYNCENCGWAGQEAMARYILPLMAVDPEGILFMTAFNDQATQLMGMPAQELKKLKDNNTSAYDAVIQKATWRQYVMRVRGKMDTYNNNTRLKSHCLTASPVKFVEEGKLLLADIAKYGDLTPAEEAA